MLPRNDRWAYTASHPRLLIAASLPLALPPTASILGCWERAKGFERVLMAQPDFASRLGFSAGMTAGELRWLPRRGSAVVYQPR